MLRKYKGWTEFQLWTEYGRLKMEWIRVNGWENNEAYDAFIKKIVDELGV